MMMMMMTMKMKMVVVMMMVAVLVTKAIRRGDRITYCSADVNSE